MFRWFTGLIACICAILLIGCGVVSATQPQAAAPTPSTHATSVPNKVVQSLLIVPALQGKVILANGSCCVGGTAGSTVSIDAAFSATSTAGSVIEMRVGGCPTDGNLDQIPWEPFVATRTFMHSIPVNWTSFYIGVQFRDDHGNISAIACDDIAVEGMP